MGFLFIRILLHKSHKEDENNRGGGYTNDDGYNHNTTTNISTGSDITISYSHLSHNLIIQTGDESI